MNTKQLLDELRSRLHRLDDLEEKVSALTGSSPSAKRTLSAKARKAIGKAQKARWKKYHAEHPKKAS